MQLLYIISKKTHSYILLIILTFQACRNRQMPNNLPNPNTYLSSFLSLRFLWIWTQKRIFMEKKIVRWGERVRYLKIRGSGFWAWWFLWQLTVSLDGNSQTLIRLKYHFYTGKSIKIKTVYICNLYLIQVNKQHTKTISAEHNKFITTLHWKRNRQESGNYITKHALIIDYKRLCVS